MLGAPNRPVAFGDARSLAKSANRPPRGDARSRSLIGIGGTGGLAVRLIGVLGFLLFFGRVPLVLEGASRGTLHANGEAGLLERRDDRVGLECTGHGETLALRLDIVALDAFDFGHDVLDCLAATGTAIVGAGQRDAGDVAEVRLRPLHLFRQAILRLVITDRAAETGFAQRGQSLAEYLFVATGQGHGSVFLIADGFEPIDLIRDRTHRLEAGATTQMHALQLGIRFGERQSGADGQTQHAGRNDAAKTTHDSLSYWNDAKHDPGERALAQSPHGAIASPIGAVGGKPIGGQ